jgi:hypothetical protein
VRRSLALLPLLLLAAPPAGQAAPAAPALGARLTACTRDGASFVGSMPALAGTERMEMRFELRAREPGEAWQAVAAPTFGVWERSEPRRAGFVYEKRVERLDPRRQYRVVIRFRWLGRDHALQRRARRVTGTCRSRPGRPGRGGPLARLQRP